MDPAYAAQRTFVGQGGQPFWCYGGDPSACAESIPKWQSTLEASPVLLTYGTMPISQLLAESAATKGDLKLQTSMAAAVQKNIAMRTRQWEAVDKCPPSCNGRGHCTKPAEACTCTQTPPPKGSSCVTGDPFVGRMCSGGSGDATHCNCVPPAYPSRPTLDLTPCRTAHRTSQCLSLSLSLSFVCVCLPAHTHAPQTM